MMMMLSPTSTSFTDIDPIDASTEEDSDPNNLSPIPQRSRAFSIGGLSMSDFETLLPPGSPDRSQQHGGAEWDVGKRRTRIFSIDFDPNLDIDDIDLVDAGILATGSFEVELRSQRGRGMSFEFFSYDMSDLQAQHDALHSTSVDSSTGFQHSMGSGTGMMGRARGDSIIFDPQSFKEGGIHEITALKCDTPLMQKVLAEEEEDYYEEESEEERSLGEEDEDQLGDNIARKITISLNKKSSQKDKQLLASTTKKRIGSILAKGIKSEATKNKSAKKSLHADSLPNSLPNSLPIHPQTPSQHSSPKPGRRSPKQSTASMRKGYYTPPAAKATPGGKKNSTAKRIQSGKVKGRGGGGEEGGELVGHPDDGLVLIGPDGEDVVGNSAVIILTSAAATAGCFLPDSVPMASLSVLNREGRVGVYTVLQRKARVEKFHEKRKMRIWRKRIKYDCRKKLADSRPRVKGRFVKRVEGEEDDIVIVENMGGLDDADGSLGARDHMDNDFERVLFDAERDSLF